MVVAEFPFTVVGNCCANVGLVRSIFKAFWFSMAPRSETDASWYLRLGVKSTNFNYMFCLK